MTKNYNNLHVRTSKIDKSQAIETKSNEYFLIGKAVTLIGVSIQTLRNWEKKGKLMSKRDELGGHRY